MSILKEFKQFAMRSNVMALAEAVIIGGVFGKIIAFFVADVLRPPIGLFLGGMDFTKLMIKAINLTKEKE